jgi:hypothetical protein
LKTLNTDFSKLQFIRIFDPIHIPKELIEQVRDRKFTVENFYKYQSIVCITQTSNGNMINPLNLLFVIVNESKKVIGFLWAIVAPLSQELVINTFSMSKEYWGKGQAVELVTDKCKEIMKEAGLSRVYWISNYPKHSERYGFKRSKGVLMEYNLGDENGRHILRERREANRDSESADPTAGQLPEFNTESDARSSEQCPIAAVAGI